MNLWDANKRLLALGGSMRGIVSIAFSARMKTILKGRAGKGNAFRLADHFRLLGDPSTGATNRMVEVIKTNFSILCRACPPPYWRIPRLQPRSCRGRSPTSSRKRSVT